MPQLLAGRSLLPVVVLVVPTDLHHGDAGPISSYGDKEREQRKNRYKYIKKETVRKKELLR